MNLLLMKLKKVFGKTKTIIQMTGISLVIAAPIVNMSYYYEFSILILMIGTTLGFYSAIKYFKESISYIKGSV